MLSRSYRRIIPAVCRRGANNNALRPHPLSAAAGHDRPSACCFCSPATTHQHRTWSNDAHVIPDAYKKKPKKSSSGLSKGASSGRIAWYEDKAKKKASALPKLCTGCGVEMVSHPSQQRNNANDDPHHAASATTRQPKMTAGEDAARRDDRSKRAQKKARYADVLDKPGDKTLCGRCIALQGGNVWKAYDALKDVDARVFADQLSHIVGRRRFGLCVVVVDATDPEFSAVRKLRDSIRGTPCILAINKADLLPRAMNRYDLNYIRGRVESNRMRSTIGAYGVSAKTGRGMINLAEGLLENLGGRDVFVVGSANVGKSTLVKSLSSLLARTLRLRGKNKRSDDRRRDALRNLNITQSHLPGTTLQAVRIPCFPTTRHALWDTPGIINRAALAYSLFPSHLMEPLAFPEKIEIPTEGNGKKIRVERGYSILIEAGWVADALNDGEEEKENDDGGVDSDDISNINGAESGEVSNMENKQQKDAGDEDVPFDRRSNDSEDQRQWNSDDASGDNSAFTLARLDIMEDNGMSIEALAFVPSSLTIRVVPTDRAPSVSAVPKAYVDKVQKLVGAAGNFADSDVSRPFSIFKGDGKGVNRDGSVDFSEAFHRQENSEWVRQDIVFASLGWINLNHRRDFTVKPWCVKDSLWSKRRALYPSNLEMLEDEEEWVEVDGTANFATMADDDEKMDEIRDRLDLAAQRGRHHGDMRGREKKAASKQYGRKNDYMGYETFEAEKENDDDVWW